MVATACAVTITLARIVQCLHLALRKCTVLAMAPPRTRTALTVASASAQMNTHLARKVESAPFRHHVMQRNIVLGTEPHWMKTKLMAATVLVLASTLAWTAVLRPHASPWMIVADMALQRILTAQMDANASVMTDGQGMIAPPRLHVAPQKIAAAMGRRKIWIRPMVAFALA